MNTIAAISTWTDIIQQFFPDSRWDINRLWQILTLILLKLFARQGSLLSLWTILCSTTATSDIQGQRPRTSSGIESVSVFDGLDVVPHAKIRSENFLGSAMVQTKSDSELCGCFVLPASRALDAKNKIYVR